jgi:uncharacterized Fe-S radical SAM superfamily protein PflX
MLSQLWIWSDEKVAKRLSWYLAVSTNRMPAKYLICRRVPVDADLAASEEELWDAHEEGARLFREAFEAVRRGEISLKDMDTAGTSLIDLKVELAERMLSHCNFCRWNCRVDRREGRKHGACMLESFSRVSSYFHHLGEELPIRGVRGSGTIFFTSCNMRCAFCVHPETVILTDRGLYTIGEIFEAAGNELQYGVGLVRFPSNLYTYSYDGRRVRIRKVFKHHYSGYLIKIKPLHAPPILVTPSHEIPVYGPGGKILKIPAKDLAPGHKLLIPFPQIEKPSSPVVDVDTILRPFAEKIQYTVSVDTGRQLQALALAENHRSSREIAEILVYHPTHVRYLVSRLRREGPSREERKGTVVTENGSVRLKTEKRPGIPSKISVSTDFAELLGYYCSEGHVTKSRDRQGSYRLVLSFGRHEEKLVDRAFELFKKVFGVEPELVQRESTTSLEVGKASIAILFGQLCGYNAKDKQVPSFLFHSEPKVIESFLKAVVAGYGCVTEGYISVNTVSKKLALGLYTLYLILGHLPSFNLYTPPSEKELLGRKVKQSMLYYVKVNESCTMGRSWSKAKHVRYKIADGYAVVPIHKIERVGYSGAVYNLEVDDITHTYMANCLAVGNCQNGDISRDKDNGVVVDPGMLAKMMWELRVEGCHNINLVGGEPTIHLHTIVKAISLLGRMAPEKSDFAYIWLMKPDALRWRRLEPAQYTYGGEFNTPILWNSNMYMSLETLKILRELVDIWLPDFKFGSDACSIKLARTPWYWETVSRNHKMIHDWGEDIVIRHLVMPNHVECCTKPVLRWISENMPDVPVNVMDQYHPDCFADPSNPLYDKRYAEIARRPTREEILEAFRYARFLGLVFESISFEKNVSGLRL